MRTAQPAPKETNPHYSTAQHRAWRRTVMDRAGWCCEDPNHDPRTPTSGLKLYADHIRELEDGGEPFSLENGMARCAVCHAKKTHKERAQRIAR